MNIVDKKHGKAVIGLLICAVRNRSGQITKQPQILDTIESEQTVSDLTSRQHWKHELIDMVNSRGYKFENVSVLKEPKYGCNIIVAISAKEDTRSIGRGSPVTRGGRQIERIPGLKTMASFRRNG
ncbi:MAG: hypothetical protein KAV87_53115 [Desulfobacteraceae bacterium]|nr:hypothetical protein [Desulfobacteraceae bacterium]